MNKKFELLLDDTIYVFGRKLFRIKAKINFAAMQPGDVPNTWADTTKLNNLGYKSTTPIEEGVEKFVQWFNTYYKSKK